MASSSGPYGLNADYPIAVTGPSRLTEYEIYQIEQYEEEELYQFEQYIKIIQFAEAVLSGIHPRVKVFTRSGPRAYSTFEPPKVPRIAHVQPVTTEIEMVDITDGLNPTPREGKKKPRKKKMDYNYPLKLPEYMPGKIFMHDPGMDYYKLLGLDSSASDQDIYKAHAELTLYQRYFEKNREKEDEATIQSKLQFAVFREELVRSIGVPHPDDPPEPYNEDFFKRATKGIVVEEKDINFEANYYCDLRSQATRYKVWNGVIGKDIFGQLLRDMGYNYILNLRQAKNQTLLDKVRSEWNEKLIAYMILKDEKLRSKYNNHNRSHKLYENLQKEYDAMELEKGQNLQYVIPQPMDYCDKNGISCRSVDLQLPSRAKASINNGNPFRKTPRFTEIHSEEIFSENVDHANLEASVSDEMTGVEQTAKTNSAVTIAPLEEVEGIPKVNHVAIANPIPKFMSQAFSISKLSLQNKTTKKNSQSSTGSLISTIQQRKVFQAQEIQAERAVDKKKAEEQRPIQAQGRSTTAPKEVRNQRQAIQDQASQKLRGQKATIQKQIYAQRAAAQRAAEKSAAVQKSLGLEKPPPTGPRVPLGLAPRMMTTSLMKSSTPIFQLNLRPQPGLMMGSPAMLSEDELTKVAGSALRLLESSEQGPASKKQRVGDRECCGKMDIKRENESWGSGSGSTRKGNGDGDEKDDERVVREDRLESVDLKEDGEISEEDGEERGGKGVEKGGGEIEVEKEDGGGKKRKRETEWEKLRNKMRNARIKRLYK
ncbi:hypothetical protein NHQ30_002654 [Ciborinia camelliae]|nr:hypothetical protein NHQ30_002654 [Ciborinia camelliae]